MGLHLCKEASGEEFSDEVGYEELEEDSSAEMMGFQKAKLQISKQSLRFDVVAEKEHEKLSPDGDETEMKPEPNSIPPPSNDVKLSITVATTNWSITKKRRITEIRDSFTVVAHELEGGWSDIIKSDSAEGKTYMMPDLDELPEKLLPPVERKTEPFINYKGLKPSKDRPALQSSSHSLFRAKEEREWSDGQVICEVAAIKREMQILEMERRSRCNDELSPNNLAVPNDMRNITGESQDLVVVSEIEYEEVDDENTGMSDSLANSIDLDYIEQKTAEQVANPRDSPSMKYSEQNSGECLETGNFVRVQQNKQL